MKLFFANTHRSANLDYKLSNIISKIYANPFVFGRYLLGCVLWLALQTHGTLDPSIYTLISPSSGVENWLGTLGSLTASFLIEHFGFGAWSLPFLLLTGSFNVTANWQAFFLGGLTLFISAFTWSLGASLLDQPTHIGGAFGVLGLQLCDDLAKRILLTLVIMNAWLFLFKEFRWAFYWHWLWQQIMLGKKK